MGFLKKGDRREIDRVRAGGGGGSNGGMSISNASFILTGCK